MPITEFQILKSKYKIECPENEKKKVLDLAKSVDKKIEKLSKHFSSADEKTLLAVLCLTMEDEISSLDKGEIEENVTKDLDKIIEKIDLISRKVEEY